MAVVLRGRIDFQWEVRALGHGDQHLFLAVDQCRRIVAGDLEAVTVRNGIGGTRFHAVPAEDAAAVIDVIDLGVTLAAADAQLRGVLGRFDINALRRASGRA